MRNKYRLLKLVSNVGNPIDSWRFVVTLGGAEYLSIKIPDIRSRPASAGPWAAAYKVFSSRRLHKALTPPPPSCAAIEEP